jgi:hypothetical protein
MTRRLAVDILFTAILAITLLFGIKPKGFRLFNKAHWIADPAPGLAFRRLSVAHSTQPLGPALAQASALTLEVLISTGWHSGRSMAWIAGIEGPAGRDLWIGAWRHCLIVNGCDRAGGRSHAGACRKKSSETRRREQGASHTPHRDTSRLTVTLSPRNTRIYIDGRLEREFAGRVVAPRDMAKLGRLVLGSAPDGASPWIGAIHELAVFDTIAEPDRDGGRRRPAPVVRYTFESKRRTVASQGAAAIDLHLPAIHLAIRPRFFNPPWRDFEFRKGYAVDMIVNLFGFIPFGLVAFFWLRIRHGMARSRALLSAALGGFAFSFGIELTQALMPTRSSQLIDLALNSGGALLGAAWGALRKHTKAWSYILTNK